MSRFPLRRYWPFVAIAVLQLVLVTADDDPTVTATGATDTVGRPDRTAPVSQDAAGVGTGAGGRSVGVPGSDRQTRDTADGRDAGGSGENGAGAAEVPAGASQDGATSSAAPSGVSQPVDALGRPLEGDRSRCAAGGLLQEDITLQSPPCMPAFDGNNGGATYPGVTADRITVVVYYPEYDAGVQQVLAANELAMTEAQADELHALLEEFFNTHYEFYGRRIELVTHMSAAADPIELRAEAKAVAQRYEPFAVLYYGQGLMPAVQADQFSRNGIVNVGVVPVADHFFTDRAPLVWSAAIQGHRVSDMAANYYCKRMHGKNATEAGDPAMRLMPRKLGVGASEDPTSLESARRFITQVTGGMCGSPADDVKLYTYSADPDTAEQQLPALVTRLREDGITTTYGIDVCAEGDRQGYFPENFIVEPFDDDFVGRVFAALCSPAQMGNSFGLGLYPKQRPKEEKEFYLTLKTVNEGYDAPYLAEAAFNSVAFFARLVQHAGPDLNPGTIYEGAQTSVQIMGWENPDPWPGWTCCNPYAPEYHVGITPDSFTAKVDARQIYWSNSERSDSDGATGAYVGVDDSRRYEVGKFSPGEPKQP